MGARFLYVIYFKEVMCRLFGLISKKAESAAYWFFEAKTPFKDFSEKKINRGPHNSGWGIGWLERDKWKIFKEGRDDVKKYNLDKIREVKSKIILIHLRHASVGRDITSNAHPFSYKNWVFEHNGGVEIKKCIKHLNEKFQKELASETDSEAYFLLIMQLLEETGDIVKAIKKTIEIVKRYSYRGLNFIMSDGRKIYAFRDVNPKNKDSYDYYCLHYLVQDDKVIFSSDALTDESWIPIKLGELAIVDEDLDVRKFKMY